MKATHRVKDSLGNTVGFIIDNKFYTDYYVKSNIEYIDNLRVLKNNGIRADRKLPELSYRETVTYQNYINENRENPFERDIENTLNEWKNNGAEKILQVEGARQVGKTSVIRKFAYKNYEYVIYVNLVNDIADFKSCIMNGANGIEFEKYCRRANIPHFVNSDKTILIIDEIQKSTEVFNRLRLLQRNLNCHIIIIGSYLGRYIEFIAKKQELKAFFSMGNVEVVTMFSMSFREFCRAFNAENLLLSVDLFGKSDNKIYRRLEELYSLYCNVGGYPSVVKKFINTKNINECYEEISILLHVFKEESAKYFTEPKQVEIFDKVYTQAVVEMLHEKRGNGKNIVETVTNIVKESAKDFVSRDEVSVAIVWLKRCGIISTCSMIEKNDFFQKQYNRRMYFLDCGIASYIMNNLKIDEASKKGLIAETFAFSELNRLYFEDYSAKKVKEDLCFSILDNKYELDFVVVGKGNTIENKVFGFEINANRGEHTSLNIYIDTKYINKGILAERTKGGRGEKFDTIPIYTVGARFPYI